MDRCCDDSTRRHTVDITYGEISTTMKSTKKISSNVNMYLYVFRVKYVLILVNKVISKVVGNGPLMDML